MNIENNTFTNNTESSGIKQADTEALFGAKKSIEKSQEISSINNVLAFLETQFKKDLSPDIEQVLRNSLNGKSKQEIKNILESIRTEKEPLTTLFNSLNLEESTILQLSILDLESKDKLRFKDKIILRGYKEKLSRLEETSSNAEEQNIVKKLEAIKSAIPSDISEKYTLKNPEKPGETLSILEALELGVETGKQEYLEVILESLRNKDTLLAISQEIHKTDPKKYEDFKETIIDSDLIFADLFKGVDIQIERKNIGVADNKKMLAIGVNDLSKVTIKKGVLVSDNKAIGISGSEYSLKSPLNQDHQNQQKDLQNEAETEISGINETLNSLSAMQGFINRGLAQNIDFASLQKSLLENSNIPGEAKAIISSATNISNLQTALISQKNDLEKQKKEKVARYKKEVQILISENTKEAQEQDEKVKQTLAFLQEIGFNKIPQTTTDLFIQNINISPGLYGFDEKINLANGIIGMDSIAGGSILENRDKVAFAKIFAKAVGLTDLSIFNPENIGTTGAVILKPDSFDSHLKRSGMFGLSGSKVMLDNILAEEKEKTG